MQRLQQRGPRPVRVQQLGAAVAEPRVQRVQEVGDARHHRQHLPRPDPELLQRHPRDAVVDRLLRAPGARRRPAGLLRLPPDEVLQAPQQAPHEPLPDPRVQLPPVRRQAPRRLLEQVLRPRPLQQAPLRAPRRVPVDPERELHPVHLAQRRQQQECLLPAARPAPELLLRRRGGRVASWRGQASGQPRSRQCGAPTHWAPAALGGGRRCIPRLEQARALAGASGLEGGGGVVAVVVVGGSGKGGSGVGGSGPS